MRTDETRAIESLLRSEFAQTDAYRYNSASIRVRVIDPCFQGKSTEQRDTLVEPLLAKLPESTQADIMKLLTLYPGEPEASLQALVANADFEDPSQSML
jgi:hypothetical protein